MKELVGDVAVAVQIDHDPEWEQFPEVGEAVKAAGGPEDCLAVATCAEHGAWAVGIASGWKGREAAAKLALALSVATALDKLGEVAQNHPDFRSLCEGAGLLEPTAAPPSTGGKKKKRGGGAAVDPYGGAPPAWEAPWGGGPMLVGPQPEVKWIMLADSSITASGMPPDAPVIAHDKTFQDTFSCAHNILWDFLGDQHEPTFEHDADCDQFPEVAQAVQQAGCEPNCQVICSAPTLGKWAVGQGGGWKTRETAGKLALAVAIGVGHERFEEICQTYPQFAALCEQAGLNGPPTEAKHPTPKKRARVGLK